MKKLAFILPVIAIVGVLTSAYIKTNKPKITFSDKPMFEEECRSGEPLYTLSLLGGTLDDQNDIEFFDHCNRVNGWIWHGSWEELQEILDKLLLNETAY